MKLRAKRRVSHKWTALLFLGAVLAQAEIRVQCPGDTDGDAVVDQPVSGRQIKCMHLSAGDGFANMADGKLQYIFSFANLTGTPVADAMMAGMLAAEFPAPLITLKEGEEFYLTVTNVGMTRRPDLFDGHSVHFHGFPNASAVFDGVPDASAVPVMAASFTYYYNIVEPGTYMYHCHVEATEHMQMGMLGNLYVQPKQNDLADGTVLGTHVHRNPDGAGPLGDRYVYNDGDGSTRYDVEFPIQMSSFDPAFHEASLEVQPLPFAMMRDKYAMLNGRGYPDTINPSPLPNSETGGFGQKMNSRVSAVRGQKILLRLSNLSVTAFFTLTSSGLPMKVVGTGARLLRGPDGKDLYYETNSITLGGGEAADVIVDTSSLQPGTYFLYTSNLNFLSNDGEDFGGMMTEVVIQ